MTNARKQTILIVEDEPALLKVYAERFEKEGFVVRKATNGQEGLEAALKEKLDLILLDILMPVMDGLAMMQELRKNKSWDKETPIIFLTNLSQNEDRILKSLAENKPAYYLVKSDWSLTAIVEKAKMAVVSHQEKEAIKSNVIDFMKEKP